MILDIILNKKNFLDRKNYFKKYNNASPFPHIVIDDFLEKSFVNELHDEARSTLKNIDVSNNFTQKNKLACNNWENFGRKSFDFISFLNSSIFTKFLEDITGIKGGAWHSDFKDAVFKNTLFKNFSIDGDTEDLHGLDCCLLQLGFLDKLWNNKFDPSGSYYESDASGYMEAVFAYAGFWEYNNVVKQN